MRFYSVEKLGPKRSYTPEGFLLCEDVPVARTGLMLYAGSELPDLDPDKEGLIRASRDAEDIFDPATIASYAGKSVTNDHPDEDVTPANFKEYEVGVILNPRRGTGIQEDLLICDFVIKDPDAIKAILGGKEEVSAGYDAEYEQIAPGVARQHNIRANHVAIVEEGRCGPRCAIGDQKMVTKTKRTWMDKIMTAFKAQDEAALKEAMEGAKDEIGVAGEDDDGKVEIHNHIHMPTDGKEATDDAEPDADAPPAWFTAHVESNNARFAQLEDMIKGLAEKKPTADEEMDPDSDEDDVATGDELSEPEESEEENKKDDTKDKTKDSASLKAAFQDVVAKAEILAPGLKAPTFDAKAPAKSTKDAICLLRRRALRKALATEDTQEFVTSMAGKKSPDLKAMTCDAVAMMFNGASELARVANNTSGLRSYDSGLSTVSPKTPAEINAANKARWAQRA